jgi:hypothetical protein
MPTKIVEQTPRPTVQWNPCVRLVFTDVDETVAGLYEPAHPEMLRALSGYLEDGGRLCLVTGGSLERVTSGVIDGIHPRLRSRVLAAPVSGAELWGFDRRGTRRGESFMMGHADVLPAEVKQRWRTVVTQLLDEFSLRPHAPRPPARLRAEIGRDPREVIFADRGSQISFEFINGHSLRRAVLDRAAELLSAAELPVAPRLTGVFALNMTLNGVSKGGAVTAVLNSPEVLASIGLEPEETDPDALEVWGDDFSPVRGGIDLDMTTALPSTVRTIDFRDEDKDELPADRNIVLWDGVHRLHHGLLEFLQTREVLPSPS